MHYTIEKLIVGENSLIQWFANAKVLWQEILNLYNPADENNIIPIAEELTRRQHTFELECGGRRIGQEIMAIYGIAQFYTTQFGFDVGYDDPYDQRYEKAVNIYKAFKRSSCSLEVKYHADDVARSYGLEVDRS